jgi:hypothetical protein
MSEEPKEHSREQAEINVGARESEPGQAFELGSCIEVIMLNLFVSIPPTLVAISILWGRCSRRMGDSELWCVLIPLFVGPLCLSGIGVIFNFLMFWAKNKSTPLSAAGRYHNIFFLISLVAFLLALVVGCIVLLPR